MIPRRSVSSLLSLLALPVAVLLAGCGSLKSISILPAAGSVVLTAVGQTAQFTAVGTNQVGSGLPTTSTITNSVTWSSGNTAVATINASGLATAVGAGTTQITAANGGQVATSNVTVTLASGGGGSSTAPTISITPASQSVSAPGQTGQFIAIGTNASGATVNLTNQVTWSSSSAQIATIGATTGLATAVGQGTATITAVYTNSAGGSVVTGSATFTVVNGTTEQYTAVSITPGSQALSASGQTGQFIALATSGSTGLKQDVTNSPLIRWSSSIPTVASVSASGLATGISAGTATITAVLTNPDGTVVSSTSTVAVSLTTAPEPLLSLTIIPSSITVLNLLGTGQFLAIGTYSTPPYVRDLTNSPNLTWTTDIPNVFTVNSNSGGNSGATAGIVTAYGSGSATVIAEATNPSDGTIQTATATFNCPMALANPAGNPPTLGTCIPGTQAPSQLSTLTV